MLYRRKSPIVEAVQWHRPGDHPAVESLEDEDTEIACLICGKMQGHGWIDLPTGGAVVCPGDWIVTDEYGHHSIYTAANFQAMFEPAEVAP